MSAQIIDLSTRRARVAPRPAWTAWENTEHDYAWRLLERAAGHIESEQLPEAIRATRAALKTLERLDAKGTTLAQDIRERDKRKRRMASADKAAATRARNRAARLAAETGKP